MSAAAEPAPPLANRSGIPGRIGEWLTGLLLFLAGAAFVLWQNSRLTVLWDLSYILENATRMALGQVPYRDFPFPYAPLTFVMQAAIIKLTGRVVLHHYLYAAAASACATVLSWRIVLRMLRDSALPIRLTAGLLSAPLVFLGTSSILPLPFYDADCTLLVLLCLWLLLRVEARGWKPRSSILCGALLATPLFVKQNTGLAFLLSVVLCMAWLGIRNRVRDGSSNAGSRVRNSSRLVVAGAAAGVLMALALIQSICGLGNYYHWTLRFAASRRLPGLAPMLGIYTDPALLWAFAAFGAGLAIFRMISKRAARWTACALLSLPFLWTVAALVLREDDSDRAEALLHLWPVLLAASLVFALWRLPRAKTFADLVPLILLGTIHGAFLSQQLWGSTYALWPLMMILIAGILAVLAPRRAVGREHPTAPLVTFTSVVCVTLLIAGGHYALSHERLSYADLSGETLHHSSLAPLRGLAMRGDWLPDFEELVAYADREIPADDAILMIPGEDLFYYTTGRKPQFPVVMIDNTVNPYSAEEIAHLARERNVRWVVVKRNLQLQEEPVAFRPRLMQLLSRDYAQVEQLNNYDIYCRKSIR